MTAVRDSNDVKGPAPQRHGRVAAICGVIVLSMAGLSFAAVPL
jgi:hypothetical protein